MTYLFDRYRGFPRLLLIQNRQADGSRRVYVGMKQGRYELAYSNTVNQQGVETL